MRDPSSCLPPGSDDDPALLALFPVLGLLPTGAEGEYEMEAGVYVGSEEFRVAKATVQVPLGEWRSVAVTYTGAVLTLFVDSAAVGSAEFDGDGLKWSRANAQPLRVGHGFVGAIDNVLIFKAAHAPEQFAMDSMCPQTASATDPDLVAYYRFNEGFGNFTRDLSKYDVPGVHGLTCAHVDQNQVAHLECPDEYYISEILYANFGLNEGTCGGYTADDSCLNVTVIDEVKARCVNEDNRMQSCSVPAYNDVFGNACMGTRKSLAIQAICKPNNDRLRFDINECRSYSGYYPGDCGDSRWSLDHAPTKVGVASTLSEPTCPYEEATGGLVPPSLLMEGNCSDWDLSTAVAGETNTFALFVLDGCGYVDFTHEDHGAYAGMLVYPAVETHFNNASFDMSAGGSCAPTTSKEESVYLTPVWAGEAYCNAQDRKSVV